jgi:signal transduction histidine kinase
VTADETGWVTLPTGVPNRIVIEHPSQTLDAGLYRLVVYAGPRFRATGGDSAVVLFTVMAPLWVRWWFVAPLVVVAIAVVFAVRWQRERTRRNIARLRTRIAADLHDSVGAGLTRIALLSDVVQQQVSGQIPAAAQSIHAIGDSARAVIDEMNDAVWFIDAEVHDVRQMLVRVRTVAAMLFEADGIQWAVEASNAALDVAISSEQRRHLFLIVKEALTNARRHARPATVAVRVTKGSQGLRIEIEDDGVPLAGAKANGTDGNGVRNMHARASELGGTLTIEGRQPAPGTRVVLQTPLR